MCTFYTRWVTETREILTNLCIENVYCTFLCKRVCSLFKSDWNALERMSLRSKPKKKRRNTTNYCDFFTFRAVPTFYGSQPKRKITHVSFIKSLHHSRTCYNKFKCFIMIIIICDQFLLNNQLNMRTKQFIMKREREKSSDDNVVYVCVLHPPQKK